MKMIRCTVCGELFEPFSPAYGMMNPGAASNEDEREAICYDCLSSVDEVLRMDDYSCCVEEVEDEEY